MKREIFLLSAIMVTMFSSVGFASSLQDLDTEIEQKESELAVLYQERNEQLSSTETKDSSGDYTIVEDRLWYDASMFDYVYGTLTYDDYGKTKIIWKVFNPCDYDIYLSVNWQYFDSEGAVIDYGKNSVVGIGPGERTFLSPSSNAGYDHMICTAESSKSFYEGGSCGKYMKYSLAGETFTITNTADQPAQSAYAHIIMYKDGEPIREQSTILGGASGFEAGAEDFF